MLVVGLRAAEPPRAVVVFCHSADAIRNYEEQATVTRRMVDAMVVELTRAKDVRAAWEKLVKPGDRVGIKVSTAGGPAFSTHRGIVEAIAAGLRNAGVREVLVWDRELAALEAAGFVTNPLFQVVDATEWDQKATVTAPMVGRLISGDAKFSGRADMSMESHLSRVLTERVDKVINLPVLADSAEIGVAGALFNMTIRNVDNWRRFLQMPSLGHPDIALVYQDPRVGQKVVLHLMDGLVGQYAGGPEFQPNYAVHHRTLYASRDPVALDATALRLITRWRKEAELPSLRDRGDYIAGAAQMGVGVAEESAIQLVRCR